LETWESAPLNLSGDTKWKANSRSRRRSVTASNSTSPDSPAATDQSPNAAAAPLAKDQHDHAGGVVPSNFDNFEDGNSDESGNIAATDRAAISAAPPTLDDSDASDQASTLQAASCSGHEPDPATDSEPQPWNVERPLPVVPPPQFADAPEKFKDAVERLGNQRLDAMLRRDKAIRARGGRASDFYEKRGQGVRCDIRDAFPTRRHTS
jgi:hypothetical protein